MPQIQSPAKQTRRQRKHTSSSHQNEHKTDESRTPSPEREALLSTETDNDDETISTTPAKNNNKTHSNKPTVSTTTKSQTQALPQRSPNAITPHSPRFADTGVTSTSLKYAVESEAIEDNPTPTTHHVMLFVNARSGNCHGRILLEELGLSLLQLRNLPSVMIHIIDFLSPDDVTAAIQRINSLLRINSKKRKHNPININVWSAGGDGTLMSVIQLLVDANVPLKDLTFAVVPFGTGNDLSQVLGWGKTILREQLSDIQQFGSLVEERIKGTPIGFDVFEIKITTHPGGGIRKFTSDGFSEMTTTLETHMGNYSAIGVQGYVGGDFEHSRTGHRLWNIAMYVWQSARWFFKTFPKFNNIEKVTVGDKVVAVGKHSKAAKDAHHKGEQIPILSAEPIEIVVQNIPGIWGRAINLWDNAETGCGITNGEGPTDEKNWSEQRTDDQKLEVYCINSVTSYAAKQVSEMARKHLTRIGQFDTKQGLTFHFELNNKHGHETCMLIDGEFFYIKNMETLTYQHRRTINMSTGQHAKIDSEQMSEDTSKHDKKEEKAEQAQTQSIQQSQQKKKK